MSTDPTWSKLQSRKRRAAASMMHGLVLAVVRDYYETWESRVENEKQHGLRPTPEPTMTVSLIKDHLAQAGRVDGIPVPEVFHDANSRQQSSMVRSALDVLVRAGRLKWSWGAGMHGGEARAYEPAGR